MDKEGKPGEAEEVEKQAGGFTSWPGACSPPAGKRGAKGRPRGRAQKNPSGEGVGGSGRERGKHENAANLPLRECFVPKFFSGAAPLDPAYIVQILLSGILYVL